MKKYKYLNTAVFRGGRAVPLYQVFDTETKKITYDVYVYGKDRRGKVSVVNTFTSPTIRGAKKWRQSMGASD